MDVRSDLIREKGRDDGKLMQKYLNPNQEMNQSQVKRRSRLETYCDILRAIGAGIEGPTHIMYKANLSWKVMQVYMKSLEVQGLIFATSEGDKRQYHLSEKGFQVLNEMLSVMEGLNIRNEL